VTVGITGTTALYAVIGDPVRHSLSPVLHNAAFAALGVDAVYVALPVPAGRGGAAVRALPVLGIRGLNVTMPHKADAAAACDELTDDAARLGVANTVTLLDDGRLLGDSTDGEGFVRALLDEGLDPAGRRVAVIGAGGAARSVVLALGRRDAAVTVWARREEAAWAAPTWGRPRPTRTWSSTPRRSGWTGGRGPGRSPTSRRPRRWSTSCTTRPRRRGWPTAGRPAGAR
jgi:shikimate dehydrogenase